MVERRGMKSLFLCLAVAFPAMLAATALAEIWCYDAQNQYLGVHQSKLTFFLRKTDKSFRLSEESGLVSFSPYYFKKDGCRGQAYTMLPKNRIARGPDGKLHTGSSPLVPLVPGSYLNDRNECVKIESTHWKGAEAFSETAEIADSEVPISFPVSFPLTYKYVQVGSLLYGKTHSGTPAGTRRGR